MPENPPISTAVNETVTVDTGADPEAISSLSDSFKDFWAEEDSKAPEAPSAPSGAGQETVVEPAGTEPKEPKQPAPAQPAPPKEPAQPEELTDEAIDRMELPAHYDKPEVLRDFKQIKDVLKQERARSKAMRDEVDKLSAALNDARQNAWTPEQKADYEHAATVRRRFDFVSDPEFIQRFHQPINEQCSQLLEEAVEALPDKEAARAWADHIRANYRPDQLNRQWWLNSVAAKIPNEIERQSLMTGVNQMLKLQKDRDTEIMTRTNDKNSFESWINERVATTQKRVQEEIMTEIGVQEKRIAEVLPRNIDEAKTKEEREAIEKHNARFQELNDHFKKTVQDLSANGPRAWVRASVEATRSIILDQELKAANDELKAAKAERDRYKAELDKIANARRRLSSSTAGTPPAPAGGKPANNNNLSIKDLDVRKSFQNYNWDQQQ